MQSGVWSLPDITDAVDCSPLYCYDPGFIPNSKRVTEFRSPVEPLVNGTNGTTNQIPVNGTNGATNETNIYATTTVSTSVDGIVTFPYNTLMQYQCNMVNNSLYC